MAQEAGEHAEGGTTVDDMLPRGLEPLQVTTEYFETCRSKDTERWLACLHVRKRERATSVKPGPFVVFNWELGRTRVEKYMVRYVFEGQVGDEALHDAEPVVTLEFMPVYGPVPGYIEGTPLGPAIVLKVQRQGGVMGQWRVMEGTF